MREVLVVEDQATLREGIVEVISTLGVKVEGCASGQEAIRSASSARAAAFSVASIS